MMRAITAGAFAALLPAAFGAYAATPPQPTDAERAAIFTAAGFKQKGDRYIRCEEDPPTMSYVAGSIEMADLDRDGRPEAWVKESSGFCYGYTAEFFVLLTRDANGAWVKLIEEVGIPLEHSTRHNGWPDIEVGGPGAGPFPMYRFDGTRYLPAR